MSQTIKLTVAETGGSIPLSLEEVRVSYIERPAYTGAYAVTPTQETQVLPVNAKRMTDDITINPIPSNYGLITWNGLGIRIQ